MIMNWEGVGGSGSIFLVKPILEGPWKRLSCTPSMGSRNGHRAHPLNRYSIVIIKVNMRFLTCLFLFSLLGVAFYSCARDKTVAGEPAAKPVEIVLRYQTQADIASDLFYFFVFNFSNAPSRNEDTRPFPYVSGPDRGRNWERYVAFNGSAPTTSPVNVYTLEREDLPKMISVGKSPKDLVAGDLDGDTHIDLIVANSGDDSISVLLNKGDGTFGTPKSYSAGDEPSRLALLDYDGDGHLDVAVTNFANTENGRSVGFLINDGEGALTGGQVIQLPAQPLAIRTAEFNADGKEDIAVTMFTDSAEGNSIAVILRGEEDFDEPSFYSVGKNPVDISVGDYDADGITDLFVVNGFDGDGGNTVSVLKGAGDGTFTDVFDPPITTGKAPSSIAVSPLNEDAFVDFVVANSFDGDGGNSVSVFLSNSDGTYGEPMILPVGKTPSQVQLFDLNRDGVPELIVTEQGGNQVRRFLGQQGGSFSEPIPAPTGSQPVRAALLDYNQDQLMDLAVANTFDGSGGNSVSLLDGTEDGTFAGISLFWTDELPSPIANEPWFRGINVGRNFLELKIDPALFTDLLDREVSQFLVDFMVATTGVDKESNPSDFGQVLDWLGKPVLVEVEIGFNTDEEREQLEVVENTPTTPPQEADLVDWMVEVN